MKLSEALRLGEFTSPLAYGEWLLYNENKQPCGACAVGRACLAAGYKPLEFKEATLYAQHVYDATYGESLTAIKEFANQQWPWIAGSSILDDVSSMYETRRYSLGQIASWVEVREQRVESTRQIKEEIPCDLVKP